jgi:hypothetical protein
LPNLTVGDVLGSVQVAALQDIPFVCTGGGCQHCAEEKGTNHNR